MSVAKKDYKRITTKSLIEMKANGEKISMLTAYDYSMAKIVDEAGVDVILVGDSASNVMAGHETTLPITLDQMIYHASSVVRAISRALVVVDLPFGSYQSDAKEALRSAIRIMKESGGHAVKLEGGSEVKESIKRILNAGIPVMGHLGLTPQSIYKFGTYTVRAKEEQEAAKLIEDAKLLENLGCFALVVEKVPAHLAEQVAKSISIPVIGIGAGGGVDQGAIGKVGRGQLAANGRGWGGSSDVRQLVQRKHLGGAGAGDHTGVALGQHIAILVDKQCATDFVGRLLQSRFDLGVAHKKVGLPLGAGGRLVLARVLGFGVVHRGQVAVTTAVVHGQGGALVVGAGVAAVKGGRDHHRVGRQVQAQLNLGGFNRFA
jgi:3-methyl-2-oxobutanoate hydroxymethyltransferase